jgi:hypothetical protein
MVHQLDLNTRIRKRRQEEREEGECEGEKREKPFSENRQPVENSITLYKQGDGGDSLVKESLNGRIYQTG